MCASNENLIGECLWGKFLCLMCVNVTNETKKMNGNLNTWTRFDRAQSFKVFLSLFIFIFFISCKLIHLSHENLNKWTQSSSKRSFVFLAGSATKRHRIWRQKKFIGVKWAKVKTTFKPKPHNFDEHKQLGQTTWKSNITVKRQLQLYVKHWYCVCTCIFSC